MSVFNEHIEGVGGGLLEGFEHVQDFQMVLIFERGVLSLGDRVRVFRDLGFGWTRCQLID